MKLQDYKKQSLTRKVFKEAYEERDLSLEMAKRLVDARIIKGLTQKELAKKMQTGQSSVARAESGDYLPSLSFLNRLAELYETELILPSFKFLIGVDTKNESGQAQSDQLIVREPLTLTFELHSETNLITYASEH